MALHCPNCGESVNEFMGWCPACRTDLEAHLPIEVRPPIRAVVLRWALGRWPLVVGLVAGLLVVILAAAYWPRPSSTPRPAESRPTDAHASIPPSSTPAASRRMVVVTRSGDLEILGPSGAPVRRLVGNVSLSKGTPRVAVPPGRHTIYFDFDRRALSGECPAAVSGVDVIASVLAVGGPAREVTRGRSPAVSPDGASLAFLRSSQCLGRDDQLVVRDLATGTERAWTAPSPEDLTSPSWAPDSRRLAVEIDESRRAPSRSYLAVFDTKAPGTVLRETARHQLPDALRWYGYLGDRGEFLGGFQPAHGFDVSPSIVTFDPEDGTVARRLFDVPRLPDRVVPDESGRHFLLVSPLGELTEWTEDGRVPEFIVDRVQSAAWLP